MKKRFILWIAPVLLLVGLALHAGYAAAPPAKPAKAAKPKAAGAPVSYYKQVRPILQARCQGCHQAAKPGGGYNMIAFAQLLKGGDSGLAAVVPQKPDESQLVRLVTPHDGRAQMPKGAKPLEKAELDVIRQWIAQGAADDTPSNARARYDAEHPPVYTRPPVITSIDYSPDGQLIAVAGFHEVLLIGVQGSGFRVQEAGAPLNPEPRTLNPERVARLIGVSERIESVAFSPDGKRLAVAGGLPGRMGEIQVWDVAGRKLLLSQPVTADTVYGASWSPDGKRIAFGCTDNTVRQIEADSGQQVLFMGSHSDWAVDTAVSPDGTHLVSVSRDGTAKLTEVATQRFVDNITSITPGALKGGLTAVASHPGRNEIVLGGADGVAKVYRMHRLAERRIGDDSNLIRRFPPLRGRIFAVAVSRDGKRIAAASSLDGKGEVAVYSYEFDTSLPDNIKAIMGKVASTRTAAENEALEKYHTNGVRVIAQRAIDEAAVYAVAFSPDGKTVAAAGADGTVRLIDATGGTVTASFSPAPLTKAAGTRAAPRLSAAAAQKERAAAEKTPLPAGTKVVGLEVQPAAVNLTHRFDTAQLLVTARLASGDRIDVTRRVMPALSAKVADVSRSGMVRPLADGKATLRLSLAGQTASVPLTVSGSKAEYRVDYVRDVMPVISRLGCNAGTCHGAAKGKNGFKLSLRGYDPLGDVRELTDDLASRRVNIASPDDSLMLLKPTGGVPHQGGALIQPGEPYYEILRNWIANGAKLDMSTPRVTGIQVVPQDPTAQRLGDRQQVRVIATYADGKKRDVSREAFVDSGNTEVATTDRTALLEAVRRGEAPVLVRFEGAYAATTLTVMGDRKGFAWKQPPANNRIDELVAAKWRRMKIAPSDLCSDSEFLRRVTLDLTGLPPTADDVRKFMADPRDAKVKREELVDRLVGNPEYVEYWTNKWADLLQVNRKFLGVEGSSAFRKWIREQVAKNTPYDEFARQILTAKGSNRENPPAAYYKILREPTATMENTTHLFLGVRFNCNKCHDHPFERWTQDQYYHLAAYFAQVGLKMDPASGEQRIGGTAVEGAKPLYEIVYDEPKGDVTHLRTNQVADPQFPYALQQPLPEKATRREQLAAWLTSKENPYFAKSYVNRLWGYLFGVGIIEPIDDIRAGNPPTNPELLNYLTQQFIEGGFNAQTIIKQICKSRTYQLGVGTNRWNADDRINYSHATARRLPAEVLYDAVLAATGGVSNIPGVPAGTRAAALPDSGVELPSGFLTTFGRPVRESACECERTSGLQLGPVMALVSGPTIAAAIADPKNAVTKLVNEEKDDAKLVNELFLRILNRPASPAEVKAALDDLKGIDADHHQLAEALKKAEAAYQIALPAKEKAREEAMAKATAELAAYEKELAPKIAEQEKQRAERTAKAEAELKGAEATIPAKLAELAKKSPAAAWTRLDPQSVDAERQTDLTKQPDLSVVASGQNRRAAYTVVAPTDLKGITAVRLEAIADPRFPNSGPGRAPDGNFVLTELEVTAAPKSAPKEAKKVVLQNAQANFSQRDYPVAAVIDGNLGQGNGWAVSPNTGTTHWATFQTKEPLGFEGGTVLTFTFRQLFNQQQFNLGRFRLSVIAAPQPVGLTLSDELAEGAAAGPEKWTEPQRAAVTKYFTTVDAELRAKADALANARKPLPIDPKLKELRETLEYASRPVPVDPQVVQLRNDLAASQQQLGNRRLTMAQDLAWALINSPAFLFNH